MLRIPKCYKAIEIHDGLDVEITDGKITIRPAFYAQAQSSLLTGVAFGNSPNLGSQDFLAQRIFEQNGGQVAQKGYGQQ